MNSPLFRTLLIFMILGLGSFSGWAQSANETGLRPIQVDGKWGFIDRTGKIVIKPQFSWVEEFSEGLAEFENKSDGRHGFIDATGKIVIEPKFDRVTAFSEGLSAAAIDLTWGFIDKSGNWVIQPQYAYAGSFSDGLARVDIPLSGKPAFPPGPENQVFIDKTGKVAIDPAGEMLNGQFTNGVALVEFVTREGVSASVLDRSGKTLASGQQFGAFEMQEGLVALKKEDKWGYVDATGKWVIEPTFKEANPFFEGLALVLVGEQWGFIDHQGKLVIPAKYDTTFWESDSHRFSEGLALVYLNGDCLYLDRKGSTVFKFECSSAGRFVGGLAEVKLAETENEQRGYVDRTGKYVWGPTPFKYKSLDGLNEQVAERRKDDEQLLPATDAERAIDLRSLVANQPDFAADLIFFRSETVSGGGGEMRIARKGNRYRHESQFWTVLGEPGKPAMSLDLERKLYNDLEPARDEKARGTSPFDPRTLVSEPKITFTLLGAVMIDGERLIKIAAARKDKENIYLYASPKLKNLIVVAQIINPPYSFMQRLSNVSLDVPDSLVSIPPDYKSIEHDRWIKVENAQVYYGGKRSKDYGVFRAPGGELFIWIKDAPYAWEYLVRPKEATTETAFQGLLLTRAGEYIWETKETEAFSDRGYRIPRKPEGGFDPAKAATVTTNSVTFRSNDYEKDHAMIEVRW